MLREVAEYPNSFGPLDPPTSGSTAGGTRSAWAPARRGTPCNGSASPSPTSATCSRRCALPCVSVDARRRSGRSAAPPRRDSSTRCSSGASCTTGTPMPSRSSSPTSRRRVLQRRRPSHRDVRRLRRRVRGAMGGVRVIAGGDRGGARTARKSVERIADPSARRVARRRARLYGDGRADPVRPSPLRGRDAWPAPAVAVRIARWSVPAGTTQSRRHPGADHPGRLDPARSSSGWDSRRSATCTCSWMTSDRAGSCHRGATTGPPSRRRPQRMPSPVRPPGRYPGYGRR